MMQFTSLSIYPIKGTSAVSLTSANVEARGLEGDRRWMIVDADDKFITQREEPRLALIKAEPSERGLTMTLPGALPVLIARPDGSKRLSVRVWRSTVNAALVDEAVNDGLSACLQRAVRLVFMDDQASRFANPLWAGEEALVSFADGYPILLAVTASLNALNDMIGDQGGTPVSMERFRPNLVVDGAAAWDEDGWAAIQIGDLIFNVVKPCDRCIVPTFDQRTGDARSDNQPTRALTRIRRSADERVKGALFGWYMIARTSGSIRLGDEVNVIERRESWPIQTSP